MKNKIKERMERILRGSILFTTLLTLAFPVQAWANVGGNETEYTYTVTLWKSGIFFRYEWNYSRQSYNRFFLSD